MSFNLGDIFVTLKAKTEGIDAALKQVNELGDNAAQGTEKIGKAAAIVGAVAGTAMSVVNKGIDFINQSVSTAIKRVDTLSNANRVFENMGFSAEDTKTAMDKLDKSIRGLPTSLDSAVSGVEMIAASTQDVGKSQQIFSALNNAVLGFGGSSEMVQGTVLQLSQAFDNGKIDGETWNSMMQNRLGPTLNAMAKQMGITTGQLKTGLSDGSISVGQFQDALIKMNKEGGGGMASLEKIAKDSTAGIKTSTENAQTAISRGIAKIITAIGTENISKAVKTIGSAFESALTFVGKAITKFKEFADFLKDHKKVIEDIAIVITGLLLPAIVKIAIQSAISFGAYLIGLASTVAATTLAALKMAASWLLALGPIGLIIGAVIAIAALIITNWDTVKGWLSAFWGWLKDTATEAWNWLYEHVIKPVIDLIIAYFNLYKDVVLLVWNAIKDVAVVVWNWLWDNILQPFINRLINGFQNIWDKVVTVFNAVKDAITSVWNWLWDNIFSPVFNRIKTGFENIFNAAKDVFEKIKSAVGSVADSIGNAFTSAFEGAKNIAKGAVNWMIDQINKVIRGVNNSAGKLPGVPDIPQVPKLAQGIMGFAGGLATVGEMGRETVWLPPGSNVYSSADTSRMAAAGGGTELHIHLDGANITSPHVAADYAEQIGDLIVDKLRGNVRI